MAWIHDDGLDRNINYFFYNFNFQAAVSKDAMKQMKKEIKLIPVLFLMTSSFFVMWTPFFICMMFWEIFTGHTLSPMSDFITVWLGGANSFVNSLIYIPTMRSYRKELVKCFTCRARPITQEVSWRTSNRSTRRMAIPGHTPFDIQLHANTSSVLAQSGGLNTWWP